MQEASPEAAATTKKEAVAGSAMEESSSTETAEEGEGVDDGDEARSEAVITFKVENFSQIRDSALSPPCIIRNLPWKIMIMQRQTQNQERNSKSVGYFLQCNGESESSAWSCQATAELRYPARGSLF